MEFETVDLSQLNSITLALTDYFAHAQPNGQLYKSTINELAVFIAPYVSNLNGSPFVPFTGTTLPNPISKSTAVTFVGAGTFTQTTGGSVTTTQPLNVLFWTSNGTTGTWTIGVAIPIDLTAVNAKINEILYSFAYVTNYQNAAINNNGYIGNTGVYTANTDYRSTDFIDVVPGDVVKYKGQSANASSQPALVGYNSSGVFVTVITGVFVSNSQYTNITIPAGVAKVKASFYNNGNQGFQVAVSILKFDFTKYSTTYNKQLFNKANLLSATNFTDFGYYQDKYISNSNGTLSSAINWRTANVPLTQYTQTVIAVSGLTVGNKYYSFIDTTGTVIAFGIVGSTSTLLNIPAGAIAFRLTVKSDIDAVTVVDTVMLNFDAVLAYQVFQYIPYGAKSIGGMPIALPPTALSRIKTGLSIASVGDSITANGVSGSLNGYQIRLQEVFEFTKYTTYGYPGQALATFLTPTGVSIIEMFIANAITHDIFTLLAGTNDFRNSLQLGVMQDYINFTTYSNGSGGVVPMNYYQALKAFVIRCYELNPKAKIILFTLLQRDNAGFTSHSTNTAGNNMSKYIDAIRAVGEYESLPVVDLWAQSSINMRNITQYTSDGLHPVDLGYKLISNCIEPKIKLVL